MLTVHGGFGKILVLAADGYAARLCKSGNVRKAIPKGMDTALKKKAENISFLARLKRGEYKRLITLVRCIVWYLMFLFCGGVTLLCWNVLSEKKWILFLVVGLIILALSLVSKMFYEEWLREKGNDS